MARHEGSRKGASGAEGGPIEGRAGGKQWSVDEGHIESRVGIKDRNEVRSNCRDASDGRNYMRRQIQVPKR